jgi:hypothetical protein
MPSKKELKALAKDKQLDIAAVEMWVFTFRFDQSSTLWFLIPTWESVQHRSSKHC